MKKSYTTPEFEVFEVEIFDVICGSPVEQYATEISTTQPETDGNGDFDPNF